MQYAFGKTTQVLHTSQIDLPTRYCDIQEYNQSVMCDGALKWKETSGCTHCMEAPKCPPTCSYYGGF